MKLTPNLNLKKPDYTDAVDIKDINDNMDAIDTELNKKADKTQVLTNVPANAVFTDTITTVNGKTGAISKDDIVALGIPSQDTVYSHPSNHPASMITESVTRRFVSDAEKSTWNSKGVVNIGTFNSHQELIGYVIINQLPTGQYVFLMHKHSYFMLLRDWGSYYKGVFQDSEGKFIFFEVMKTGVINELMEMNMRDISLIGDIIHNIDTLYGNKVDNSRVLTDVPTNAKFTDTIYTHPSNHPASMITESAAKRFVSDTEKSSWSNKWDYNESTIKAVKVNNASNADTVNGKTVGVNVPAGAKFTDTVYSHPTRHPASMITDLPTGKKVARSVVGTSTAGWTAADCDYLCDGKKDQVEINAAITALPETGGEIVILDGTYNIGAKIDVTKDNVSIRGNGNATILKRMFNSSSEGGVITLSSRSGCKIANLQIEGNKTSYTDADNFGIYLNGSSSNIVTGNTCNNNSSGIYLYDSSNDNTVADNTCNNNNNHGIYLGFSSNDSTVADNTCNNNNNHGIYLQYSNDSTVTGNTCKNNNNHGIYLYDSNDSTVTGNTCNNNNNNYGIYLGYSSNNTVTGNTCNDNSSGIYLYDSSNNTVTGNTYNDNNYGIYLYHSSNNTVTSNTCTRGTGLPTDYTESQHTIRLRGTDNNYNLISNNNCMGKAVTNEGGTGNTLVNNKFDAS